MSEINLRRFYVYRTIRLLVFGAALGTILGIVLPQSVPPDLWPWVGMLIMMMGYAMGKFQHTFRDAMRPWVMSGGKGADDGLEHRED